MLKYFSLFFSQKTASGISCNFFSSLESICLKGQILFSGKNKKNIINLSSAEFAHRVVMVMHVQHKIRNIHIINIGIKHGFSCINIRQVPWEVLKTEAEGRGFQHLPRDLANVNALKNHLRSLLLHKN